MRRKFIALPTIVLLAIVVSIPLFSSGSSVTAATDVEIETLVTEGLTWLAAQQDDDTDGTGCWYGKSTAADTCLAVLKFEERALDLGFSTPFDSGYDYHEQVEDGLNCAFGLMTVDGDFVHVQGRVYETGICMMAVAASAEPDKVSPVDSKTFRQVLQGMMAWMEDAQNAAADCHEGGWGYSKGSGSDNSNSGYATLGIGFAARMGVFPTAQTLTRLDTFIGNIQDYDPGTGAGSGGSTYVPCPPNNTTWLNILKTGNLLYEMVLVPRAEDDPAVPAAIGYIETNWDSLAVGPAPWLYPVGWHSGGDPDKGDYQAMFTMMKGLEAYGVTTLGAIDWFADVSDYIRDDKQTDDPPGSYWTGTGFGGGDPVLETSWALLTLQKVVEIPPTPTPTPAVGGIVDINVEGSDSLVASAEEGSAGSSVPYSLVLAGGLTAAAVAVAAGTLYARRRWLR